MRLEKGKKCPDFDLPVTGGGRITRAGLAGKKAVLYFYPKDDTPGCTQEACDFRDSLPRLTRAGARVAGISRDSLKSHEKFAEKHDLNFLLASDEDGSACEAFGVWVEKSMYGRRYMGIERTTVLIDERGILLEVWHKVKVKGHVEEVLAMLKNS